MDAPTITEPTRCTSRDRHVHHGTDALLAPERGYVNGEYLIRKIDPGVDISPVSMLPGEYADAVLAVDARLVGPADGRTVSLACRGSEDFASDYRLTVQPATGQFELVRWDAGRDRPLQNWQPSDAIRRGNDVNRLELSCAGSTIAARINGVPVIAVQDATYLGGRLWISCDDLEGLDVTVEARFDNLIVTQP
jgi:hypothetical protein